MMTPHRDPGGEGHADDASNSDRPEHPQRQCINMRGSASGGTRKLGSVTPPHPRDKDTHWTQHTSSSSLSQQPYALQIQPNSTNDKQCHALQVVTQTVASAANSPCSADNDTQYRGLQTASVAVTRVLDSKLGATAGYFRHGPREHSPSHHFQNSLSRSHSLQWFNSPFI